MNWMDAARALGSLLVVLGMIGVAAYALRRWGDRLPGLSNSAFKGAQRRLQVLEALSLDARHRLYLVRCGEREHLILTNPNGVAWGPVESKAEVTNGATSISGPHA
jgi:flagellar protein FliO/FliZ